MSPFQEMLPGLYTHQMFDANIDSYEYMSDAIVQFWRKCNTSSYGSYDKINAVPHCQINLSKSEMQRYALESRNCIC